MKTSLGVWALGPMITRVAPRGSGPRHGRVRAPLAQRVRPSDAGLRDPRDGA